MSRILKRPMFRIGGSANEEGIMNMAVPKRAGYQEPTGAATTLDNYKIDPNDPLFKEAMRNAAIMSQFAGAGRSRDSRLSDLLIRGGLRTLSERPAGNIFATVGRAFTPAVDEYLKGEDTEESFQRQLRLAGLTSAMTAQENREKYKKELELAGQKLEQGEKELFLKTSGLGAKGYGVWETLTGLKKAGEKINFAGVDLVSGVPDKKQVRGIAKDTVFYDTEGKLYKKTDDKLGIIQIDTTGAQKPDSAIVKEPGFFQKYSRSGLQERQKKLLQRLEELKLQKANQQG
jgi:hypothetical protein